ncbi:ABC-2 transporter permease [Lentibacillus sp.]|uniref:ABC-2 transporter permease n=1 Tax=Lentibacillus sp. TaxID=1925746 RepID=UPI002B4B7207|nr:ABC-2 transporter permease [Lentibacillus sp.]HLS10285.1 ABC-2 transporter permease [Lentibacillus sp.]
MGALIKRELRALNIAGNYKNPELIYGFLGIGYPLIVWLLGPGLAEFYDVENFNLSVSILGMALVMLRVDNSLEREGTSRQINFLQTLPLKKSQIVSAKFISVLLLSGMTVVWMNMVILLTIFISGASYEEYGLFLGFFSSLIIFIVAMTLLAYFFKGPRRHFLIGILSIIIWANVFGLSGFYLTSLGIVSGYSVFLVFITMALIIYFICWQLSITRVKKKGFPLNEGTISKASGGRRA